MIADVGPLEDYLSEMNLDGYLIHASGADADQRYLARFDSADPYTSLVANGSLHLLVRGLDRNLARSESRADSVAGPESFDRSALATELGREEADRQVIRRFLAAHDVDQVAVPGTFPVRLADALRDRGVMVRPDDRHVIGRMREVKTTTEVDAIRRVQRATEDAMAAAERLLVDSEPVAGILHHDEDPLTSERVREAIAVRLLREGCLARGTIVAGGSDAADPHARGSGPLPAGEPIVIDIFPADADTQYHADMTRTFCVGDPAPEALRFHAITEAALDAGIETIEPGVTGADVHKVVCDVYEDAGFPTARSDPETERGFVHGTGHGVGLEVHEGPSVNEDGGALRVGHVITVEPGCYDPAVGGVRIEDLVVVTEGGCENLTAYDRGIRC